MKEHEIAALEVKSPNRERYLEVNRRLLNIQARQPDNFRLAIRLAPIAREKFVCSSLADDEITYVRWGKTVPTVNVSWYDIVWEILQQSGFFLMLEALENLENDAGQIEANAWRMVQEAIRRARNLDTQDDFTFGEVLGGVQRRADEIPW